MKIMVVGSGGREHALIKAIRKSPEAEKIYALPGNGGIARDAECIAIGAKDISAITAFAREKGIDYAVVAPDDPLVLGCVDALAFGCEATDPALLFLLFRLLLFIGPDLGLRFVYRRLRRGGSA